MKWSGVFPAITTPFSHDGVVDEAALRTHVDWMIQEGCTGIVPLGSLGEGATLKPAEKRRVLELCREVTRDRVPLVASIAALSTDQAITLAREAETLGVDGLMVLPPYVYRGDAFEMETYFRDVLSATPLPAMLYNNPIAYGTDLLPKAIERLASEVPQLQAVKESSGDIRRVTELRRLAGDRLALFVGVDDLILEGIAAGAVGWIAGLVNAFPAESVRLFALAASGRNDEARALYEWFLPLLRLDTVPKFVQLIKLAQAEVGAGSALTRPPRLALEGEELAEARQLIRASLKSRP